MISASKEVVKDNPSVSIRSPKTLQFSPGIESLSTPILRLMDKGVTALQNIRLLKLCSEFGIQPLWNIMYGFPGEPPDEYEQRRKLRSR